MAAEHAAVADNPNIGCTGLDHRKMGMWAFLGSECMFFGSLIGTYLSYKGKSLNGPGPHEINLPISPPSGPGRAERTSWRIASTTDSPTGIRRTRCWIARTPAASSTCSA